MIILFVRILSLNAQTKVWRTRRRASAVWATWIPAICFLKQDRTVTVDDSWPKHKLNETTLPWVNRQPSIFFNWLMIHELECKLYASYIAFLLVYEMYMYTNKWTHTCRNFFVCICVIIFVFLDRVWKTIVRT